MECLCTVLHRWEQAILGSWERPHSLFCIDVTADGLRVKEALSNDRDQLIDVLASGLLKTPADANGFGGTVGFVLRMEALDRTDPDEEPRDMTVIQGVENSNLSSDPEPDIDPADINIVSQSIKSTSANDIPKGLRAHCIQGCSRTRGGP